MKPLNALLLSTALTVASHAHSQADLTSIPAGLLGGILPSVLDLTNQSLPLVNDLLSNELIGGLVPLTSDLLGPILAGGLPLTLEVLDGVLPLLDGLTASGIPLPTADLLGPLLPTVLETTNVVVIPLLNGVIAGGII
ncbi:hypothetical protein [Zhongshania marina]|uniref:Uncharacterized protein n=1 Tax=Zhongshania marina TaxID=2304603 RepID=A0A2S4HH17_9GAMM|nr:hypothetical protein [Marortus luteolus]POP53285.1 hypothetical protein C0068_07595 [Marortus luteolus]